MENLINHNPIAFMLILLGFGMVGVYFILKVANNSLPERYKIF